MSRELHVYTRHIDLRERTSLSVLAGKIAPGSRVLDLGCGSGALGSFLHQQLNCTVDGVTFNSQEAAIAQPHYRDVVVADLEQLNLAQAFAHRQYDYIVCADVLEHLKQPERILADCRSLLAESGQLLISLPNAAYSGLLMELMQGEFRYRPEGLLDRTHLRFFTRQSLLRFLTEQQWSLTALETIERPLDESEFRHRPADGFPPAVVRYLLSLPDALTYQFIATVRPASDPATLQAAALLENGSQEAHATFTSNLYWADAHQFSEAQKLICKGDIGQLHQRLCFELPASEASVPTLRWDPADRPGFMHLHRIRLKDGTGAQHWIWDGPWDSDGALAHTPCHQITLQPALATAPGSALMLLSGDDPWMHLPIPHETLRQCLQAGGAVLEMEVGWPMSADYAALATSNHDLQQYIQHADREVQKWQAEHHAVAQAHAEANQSIVQLREQMQEQQHDVLAQQQSLQERVQEQQLHIREQHQYLGEQQQHLQEQQSYIQELQAHLQHIESSGIYRFVQSLIRTKTALRDMPPPKPASPLPPLPQLADDEHPAQPPASPVPLPAAPKKSAEPAAREPAASEAVPSPQPQASTAPASMVDVIVPVYRGLPDTRRCLDSVLNASTSVPFQLIVINDASPEPELSAWLRDLAAREPRITLLENPENLGFVGTVNRGMALNPSHDVLLLNSDTEVAGDWLDRLYRAAYRHADTGSVTPLSNNATICSYPRFCENNALPAGLDTAGLDQLCAAANPGASIDIPTAVGFCMYIRRDCLQQTGLFDVEHFGKGYGEENDFCMRARAHGWRHQLALDTFVLHTGGVSFGDSKTPREQAAYETLKQLHPEYDPLVQAHLRENPGQAARHAIDKARIRQSTEPRILMVMHNVGGGTQRHVHELAAYLKARRKAVVLGLTPLPDYYLRLQWLDSDEGYQEEFHWPTESDKVVALLRELGVCHIHYHHLLGVSPELMRLPQRLGVAYDFTAHDYYTACPQITLTSADYTYCGEKGLAQCTSCLQQRPASTQESIEDWRLRHRLFLQQARYVLAPSRDTARRLMRYFPAANIRYVPHLDIAEPQALPRPRGHALSSKAHLRVFVLGAVSAIKGGNLLEAVALEAARTNAPIEFHLLGYPHRQMRTQPHASLTIHGPYDEEQLPLLLQRLQPDLVWFPALWPETYSYTLSACLQAGLPVVAPDIGAFSERLSERPWTWLRPWNTSVDAWLSLFLDIRAHHYQHCEEPIPAPTATASELDARLPSWSYDHDYLTNAVAAAPVR